MGFMIKPIGYSKRKCRVEGCEKLTRNKGFYKGKIRYGSTCQKHHGYKGDLKEKMSIENKVCEICGWDKSYCDRHRVKPELGYTVSNVKVLCPNCHRLVTVGLLSV